MATFQQLIRKPRKIKLKSQRRPALMKCPQKKGVCIKLVTRTPKKTKLGDSKISFNSFM